MINVITLRSGETYRIYTKPFNDTVLMMEPYQDKYIGRSLSRVLQWLRQFRIVTHEQIPEDVMEEKQLQELFELHIGPIS